MPRSRPARRASARSSRIAGSPAQRIRGRRGGFRPREPPLAGRRPKLRPDDGHGSAGPKSNDSPGTHHAYEDQTVTGTLKLAGGPSGHSSKAPLDVSAEREGRWSRSESDELAASRQRSWRHPHDRRELFCPAGLGPNSPPLQMPIRMTALQIRARAWR